MTHAAHTVYFDSGTIISHKAMPSRHKSCSFNRKVLWRNSTTTNGIPPNWLCGLKLWEFGLFKFSNLARCNGFFTFHVSFRRSHQAQRGRFDHRSSSYSFSRRSFIKQRGRKYISRPWLNFRIFTQYLNLFVKTLDNIINRSEIRKWPEAVDWRVQRKKTHSKAAVIKRKVRQFAICHRSGTRQLFPFYLKISWNVLLFVYSRWRR